MVCSGQKNSFLCAPTQNFQNLLILLTDIHYNLGFSLEPPFAPEDDVYEKACLNFSFFLLVFWFLSLQQHLSKDEIPRWTRTKPFSNTQTQLRAWLHGEFQPGLKFRSAHRAETLLRLQSQFQPGRKTQISMRMFTEVRKRHSGCACSRSLFGPGLKKW